MKKEKGFNHIQIHENENSVLKSYPSSKQSPKTEQLRDIQSYKTSASSDKKKQLDQDPVKITKQAKSFGTPEYRSKRGDEDNNHKKDQLMLDEDAAYHAQVVDTIEESQKNQDPESHPTPQVVFII